MKLKPGMREKPNGSIEYRFVIDGKRYSVTAKSVKELSRKEQELRTSVAQGTYIKNGGGMLNDYYQQWIDRKKLILKDSSIHRYKMAYDKHIRDTLGKMRIKDIKRGDILNVRKDIAESVSFYTANWFLDIIKGIFAEAMRDGILKVNPANNIVPLKVDHRKASKTTHRALTIDEQKRFLEGAKNSVYRNLYSLALASGMRTGELLALSWSDISDEYIHVRRTVGIGMDGNPVLHDTPKTEKSDRMIPVTKTIGRILEDQRLLCSGIRIKAYPDLVFHTMKGTLGSTAYVGLNIKSILRRMDEQGNHIDAFTPHALRDTFATRYIEQGGSMHTLRDILGHTSLSMTMDLYAHVMPDTIKSGLDRFDAGL